MINKVSALDFLPVRFQSLKCLNLLSVPCTTNYTLSKGNAKLIYQKVNERLHNYTITDAIDSF